MRIVNDLSSELNEKTAVTLGNFDGVHRGHCKVFSRLTEISIKNNLASVAITFNNHTKEYLSKLKRFMIIDLNMRIDLIRSLGIEYLYLVDFNKKLVDISALEFLKIIKNRLNAEYIVVGSDCKFGRGADGDIKFLESHQEYLGYKLIEVELSTDTDSNIIYSSSQIREFIERGNIERANKNLGYSYRINGKVVRNAGLGSKIGYPTANIECDPRLLLPRFGVYAARILIDGSLYNGVMNIGVRPTIDGRASALEMHIFDFSKDIYGKNVSVFPVKFIREEKKFPNLEELTLQIAKDAKIVKASFCE